MSDIDMLFLEILLIEFEKGQVDPFIYNGENNKQMWNEK
jgi:hypothetical protein